MKASIRAFDVLVSAAALIVLSPFFLICAALIKASDGGTVFYRQSRVGRHGADFTMLKFRTMVMNADRLGGALTVGEDRRITRLGRFLRNSKLDELPQLINVLRGEMTFVGPRPEVRKYVNLYSDAQRAVLELTPGITDPASIEFIDESELLGRQPDPEGYYIDVILPRKIALNIEYGRQAALLSNIGVILRTVLRIAGAEPKS